jgi:hypothetical protein
MSQKTHINKKNKIIIIIIINKKVWVGILLFNVITGLIVDTFSSLREEAGKRESVLTDSCFVCGYTKDDYVDLGLPPSSPTFVKHKTDIHDMWNYVREKMLFGVNVYMLYGFSFFFFNRY